VRKRSIASSFYTKFLRASGSWTAQIGPFLRGEPIADAVERMLELFAGRFVCKTCGALLSETQSTRSTVALDLATGTQVRLTIDTAGDRAAQQSWVEACARRYGARSICDYGFIGRTSRFEANPLYVTAALPEAHTAASVFEWLESGHRASSRILPVLRLPDARELRLRGFVAIQLHLLRQVSLAAVWRHLRGHSIVLLDSTNQSGHLALAFLQVRHYGVRDAYAFVQRATRPVAMLKAAETRVAYVVRPQQDARTTTMFTEGARLVDAGRHAAAERTLRAAAAAFDRRDDRLMAGRSELALGSLLLTRGRAADALACFGRAHDRFQRERAPGFAIAAMIQTGLAETDLVRLPEAERSCRAAYSSGSAANDSLGIAGSGLALARVLFHQKRNAEARDLLESLKQPSDAHLAARYWCLVARLRLSEDGFRDARAALEHARSGDRSEPSIECVVRRWEGSIQARLGDAQALDFHIRAGLQAARSAHLPLESMKLRLTLIEGLVDAGKHASARAAAARLHGLAAACVPPLLKAQIDRVRDRVNQARAPSCVRPSNTARETASRFPPRGTADDLDAVRELLSASHQHESEGQVLVRAAAAIRKHTCALGVGIYGFAGAASRLLASSGTTSGSFAERACAAGILIGPESTTGGIEAAIPLRYLGRLLGALSIRWSVEGPVNGPRTMAFCGAAAAACSPVVFVLLEREHRPARDGLEPDLIGVSAAMEEVRRAIHRAGSAPFAVLIEGESGSGKELVARAIHRNGARRERRFCAFNCAAMAEDLVDAELFGHTKGAFTGATGERLGLFESAEGGTVFLDEVGELSARAQAKVLRALQEGEVRRVGENFTRPFDARLVAATNRPLRAEVEAGRFRQDLLYRLDVIRIGVPPLRDRVEDIPLLAARFWRTATERMGTRAVLGHNVISALTRYDWPGNVRELQNVLNALAVAAPSRGIVRASELPNAIARAAEAASDESLQSARTKFEERFVRAALARAAGHRGRAAAALGLSRQGLAKLLQRLNLEGQRRG
jgi:DNA-binding NtrC family response regulator